MQSWFTKMRKEKGVPQKQLSTACGYSAPTWLKLEEDPSLFKVKDLTLIAKHLDTSVENLVTTILENSGHILVDSVQIDQTPEIVYSVTEALAKSGKTFREFRDLLEAKSHSSPKRNLESWVSKSNEMLSKIGYKIGIVRK